MAIGSKAGDMRSLKRDLKSSGGDDRWFWRVPADDEVRVRFMAEPYNFVKFFMHFDNTRAKGKQAYPCTDDGSCVGCEENLDKRVSWAAPVIDIDGDRVRVLQVGKMVMDVLYARADRYDTIMDRDMLVMREGSTKDNTKYMIDALDRKRRDLKKYAEFMPDIEEMLEEQLRDAMDDDDGDDWGKPARGVKKSSGVKKGTAKKSARAATSSRRPPDDDDDDEPPRRGVKRSTGAARTSGVRKSSHAALPAKTGGLKKKQPPAAKKSGGLRRK